MRLVPISIILLLVLLLPVSAIDSEKLEMPYNYEALEIGLNISSGLLAKRQGSDTRLSSLQANLTFVPLDTTSQIILGLETISSPESSISASDSSIVFKWDNSREDYFSYAVQARVKSHNRLMKISKKHPFPLKPGLQTLGTDYRPYTAATDFIDINDDIRKTASGIIEGETDYYRAVFKLADWVYTNINYTIGSDTEGAVQKSSWVLENKIGMCDEKSNLFISLARTVGIPARFIGGVAYSNIKSSMGEHGWAEVYFPGEGWVPVDPTFGQIGWVDPTHIKMKESMDSGEPSVNYAWKSIGVNFKMNPLKVEAEPKSFSGNAEPLSRMEIEPLRDNVAPGSYMPVQLKIENPNDFYLPLTVTIKKAPGLTGSNTRVVVLQPLETKYLFWTLKIPDDAKEYVLYTSYIEAEDQYGSNAQSNIRYAIGNELYSKEWALEQVQRLQPRDEKSFLNNVMLSCALDHERYYPTDTATIGCGVSNTGNTRLSSLRVCYNADCRVIDLEVGETKQVSISFQAEGVKPGKIKLSAETKHLIRESYIDFELISLPRLAIESFGPAETGYGDDARFSLLLNMSSAAYDVEININDYWKASLGNISAPREILIPFDPKKVIRKNADVVVSYKDSAGKPYEIKKEYQITVNDIPLFFRFLLWIESLF
ncbi:MAG: transglutaminase-like domain-containing protein [Candidatus Woesearchaeota archaeon]